MTAAHTAIRAATLEDLPHVVAAIVTAFLTDPSARFAWPQPSDYLQAMPRAIQESAKASIAHGAAYLTADHAGAALWLPPGAQPGGDALETLFRDTAPPDHLGDLLATFDQMGKSHPTQPHWHLTMVGVEPNAQGRGLGAALLRDGLARCDRDPVAVYLETANPRNMSLYQRFGFEATGRIQFGAGPAVTPMLRRPR